MVATTSSSPMPASRDFHLLLEMEDPDWHITIDVNLTDVAAVVVFLASDAARMVSGATYDVTGGDSAHNTA
jgi:NAD(P)-dependent dehydrogenase (short-subunit alcohol dehydrogenase family)